MDLVMMTLWAAGYDLPPEPAKAKKQPLPVIEKGCCKHCGKKIGRGLQFHEKVCK